MYKLIKTKITGLEGRPESEIGLNANYRTTMGWNETSQTINVKVEKIVRPDLTRGEDVEYSFEEVDQRTFTIDDFPMNKDLKAWVVDFDVLTGKIKDPFDVYAYTSTIISGSNFHRVMWRNIQARYNTNLIPCFTVDKFYKSDATFSSAVLQFHYAETSDIVSNTIIENSDAEEMTQIQKIVYVSRSTNVGMLYEVLDSEDNVISSNMDLTKIQQESLDGLVKNPDNNELVAGISYENNDSKKRGNRYKVSLPNSSLYKIRVVFVAAFPNKSLPVSFEVSCVNGTPNKTRVISGLKDGETSADFNRPNIQPNKYCGQEIVKVNTDLNSGDFFKLKLSCGDFYSYSELWVEIE